MRRCIWGAISLGLALTQPAFGAARHDFCDDVGDSFVFGVSSYGDLRDWAGEANAQGADLRMLYVYILAGGMENPGDFEQYYVRPFAEEAIAIGATPVFTFYQLLDIGRAAGHSGTEIEVVEATLQDSEAMRTYFDNFVWLLEIAATLERPALIQVEPDSWGFMMWGFGSEGNGDARSVPVAVSSSGHPDVDGFEDNASGLGRALLALRDEYAPGARMGWHASNFRAGTRPDVVVDFYATMGDWDVLVSEEPHVTGADWWEPWPEDAVATNLDWMQTVTDGSGLPLLLWQMPIGFEGRLLDPSLSPRGVERFAEAGVVGVLFEHIAHRGETDPDAIRADGDSGAVPPADAVTDGTAAGLREQMIAYARDPMRFPAGSVCAVDGSGPGDAPVEGTGGSPQSEPGPPGGAPPLADEPTPAPANEPNPRPADDDGSCACSVPGFERSNRVTWVLLSCLLFVVGLRREGCSRYPNERTSTRAWHRSASTYIPRAPRRPDPARR